MAPGIQDFTYFNIGKETVHGTPVAPTRQMYAEGTGVLAPDLGLNFHENENRGRRSNIGRVTQQLEDVSLKMRMPAVSFDDLVPIFAMFNGTATGVGGAADKTWTQTPSMTAATNNPPSYSIDVGDDVQNWRVQWGMISRLKMSAALGQVTSLEADWFGQRAIKGAKASPAANSAPKIPAELWTAKFAATFAGLAGASVQTNLVVGWELELFTGDIWRHYFDGNFFGAQNVETSITGTLKLTTEGTAFAVSEFYDKWAAQTTDYLRLKATSPVVLGGSFYSAQMDIPIVWSKVPPITKEDQGVNLYEVEAKVFDDGVNPSFNPVVVSSLTALP
jgi:hypothetical protein